jgi:hypothetical protein
MQGAAIALAHAAWSSAHGRSAAINWVSVIWVIVASVTITFGVVGAVAGLWRPRRGPSDDDDGDFGGGGGPGPDLPRGPEGDPAWWPEFERQFAAHVEGLCPEQPVDSSLIVTIGASDARWRPIP